MTQAELAELLWDMAYESEQYEGGGGMCLWAMMSVRWLVCGVGKTNVLDIPSLEDRQWSRVWEDEITHLTRHYSRVPEDELFMSTVTAGIRQCYRSADGEAYPKDDPFWFGHSRGPKNIEHRMTFLALLIAMNEEGDLV